MAENEPNSEPLAKNVPMPIDPDEALKEVNEALAILPKQRFGCLGRFVKYGAVLLVLQAMFIYWNFLRSPLLIISKETTHITEPLTHDGTRVDYFAALEQELYRPEMKTEDNGYRMIVRALGDTEHRRTDLQGNIIEIDTQAYTAQVYEKLGLDPTIKPTMSCIESYDFLRKYGAAEGLDPKQIVALYESVHKPWTLDDLPMMGPWLEEAGPVLNLVSEAVRKPTFCFPLIRPDKEAMLVKTNALSEISRTRSFARMLQTRAHYRIGIGDIDGAIDDVITCERLGRHMECQRTLIARFVGLSFEGIAAGVGIAASRESQPAKEQLQRFVNEHNALPTRPNLDRTWLAERYDTLDALQSAAMGDKSPTEVLTAWGGISEHELPGITAYLTVDWNVVLRRVNELYDDFDETRGLRPPTRLSLGDLFLGVRSRHVGDLLAGLSFPTSQAVREVDRRTDCMGNVHRITLAMLLYERDHGRLPPAYTVDATGNPLHSWRVLLLPYLGEEKLYGKLHLDEPWDSEHNRQFHDEALAIYQCPRAKLEPGQTTYSVVVGENTAFQAGEGKSLDDFGMHLILVVERQQGVCWMDPASELAESIASKGINRREEDVDGIGSPHPGGVNAGLRDGGVRYITEMIELPSLQGLLDGTAEEYRQ